MPLRDTLTVLLALIGAGAILATRREKCRGLFLTASVLTLIDQILTAGPHWQALPAVAALAIACVFFGRGFSKLSATLAVLSAGLAMTALALMWILPIFSLPTPTGSETVGTRTLHLHDARAGRELVVQIWYPAADSTGRSLARYSRWKEAKPLFLYWAGVRTNSFQDAAVAPGAHPLLLFDPMWGGRRTQDTFLAEDLASHGYLVASVDHPENASLVETTTGNVIKSTMAGALSNVNTAPSASIREIWAKEVAVWVRDDETVLDQLLVSKDLHLDPSRIGAFGHSFGGAASMALLGKDPRVRCALNMDGWTFDALQTRTNQPIMFLYAGPADSRTAISIATEPGTEGELDRYDAAAVQASLQRFGGIRATLAGTQHLDFTDQTLLSPLQRLTFTGPAKGERVRTIVRALVLNFFDRELLEEREGLPNYQEVRIERYTP